MSSTVETVARHPITGACGVLVPWKFLLKWKEAYGEHVSPTASWVHEIIKEGRASLYSFDGETWYPHNGSPAIYPELITYLHAHEFNTEREFEIWITPDGPAAFYRREGANT